MTEPIQVNHAQQVLVPAFTWQDETHRSALLVKVAHAMLQQIDRDGYDVVGDVGDAEVTPTFLKAQVAEVDGVRFVAYDVCEPGMADLVMVYVSHPIVERT